MSIAAVLHNEQRWHVEVGNALDVLRTIPDGVVQCCVTSPPYYGLRRYSDSDVEIGTEQSLAEYIANLVAVFREVRRTLRDDGICWLNLGDSYYGAGQRGSQFGSKADQPKWGDKANAERGHRRGTPHPVHGLKFKDLIGIPWRVAAALQQPDMVCPVCDGVFHIDQWQAIPEHFVDGCSGVFACPRCSASVIPSVAQRGWFLRSDTIWSKDNPMPESVEDRPTSAHEHVFLLAKSERYFYDHFAVLEPFADARCGRDGATAASERNRGGRDDGFTKPNGIDPAWRGGRNLRDVWSIPTSPTPFAHFATFPPELVRRCLRAGTSERGCCPSCGAPWKRVVTKGEAVDEGGGRRKHAEVKERQGETGALATGIWHRAVDSGWQPTCACPPSDPIGCVVIDPFNGSGTTGEVAMQLGCRYLGIDLNPDYADIWNRRIGFAEAHPHTKPSYRQPAVNPAQPALFEAYP